MGWFTTKKPDKKAVDWENLMPGNVENSDKAVNDIANMTSAELKRLVRIRGVPAEMYSLYSAEEIAAYLADD
jgi:hypothetical protein